MTSPIQKAKPLPLLAPSARGGLHELDFVVGQAVELVDELVDLSVGCLDLSLESGLDMQLGLCSRPVSRSRPPRDLTPYAVMTNLSS